VAFIYDYARVHERPPTEEDIRRKFQVSPPRVHQIVPSLERVGLIRRQPDIARSIEVLVPPEAPGVALSGAADVRAGLPQEQSQLLSAQPRYRHIGVGKACGHEQWVVGAILEAHRDIALANHHVRTALMKSRKMC
jgi:hypothetical protein